MSVENKPMLFAQKPSAEVLAEYVVGTAVPELNSLGEVIFVRRNTPTTPLEQQLMQELAELFRKVPPSEDNLNQFASDIALRRNNPTTQSNQ